MWSWKGLAGTKALLDTAADYVKTQGVKMYCSPRLKRSNHPMSEVLAYQNKSEERQRHDNPSLRQPTTYSGGARLLPTGLIKSHKTLLSILSRN